MGSKFRQLVVKCGNFYGKGGEAKEELVTEKELLQNQNYAQ